MAIILFLVWLAYCASLASKLRGDDVFTLFYKSGAVGIITLVLAFILS